VLTGSAIPSTLTAPTAFAMPALGWRLDDAQVAEVATFARASWGNHAGVVSAAQVARLRKSLPPALAQSP
jgi:alcohol dehydrogenase (quinone), cytochrome c subunit